MIKGIRFAADQGAVAVTSSLGPIVESHELSAAIEYAEQKGTIFIDVHPEFPVYTKARHYACAPQQCDERIIHSGLVSVPEHPMRPEPNRDIYVWPYEIHPVFRDGWGASNGPPIVAGVVALMKSVSPKLRPQEVRSIIKQTAYVKDGFAVLDAEAAVKEAIRQSNMPSVGRK